MTKFDIANVDPDESHLVNINVYKPDGIKSFWNWITRKNTNQSQHTNIEFKINKEELDKIKLAGFDFQRLQNLEVSNKNKVVRPCNVFAIPKTDFDPFLIKSLHPAMNTKTFVKRLISKSTISIRSKKSCVNLKYVRKVRSQKSVVNSVQSSKASFKVSMRSNTYAHSNSNQQQRNMYLQSVHKNNTNRLFVIENIKSPKVNKMARNNAAENSNVIPMLLTRMKSMEEHLSDIENKTLKIKEAVSQRNGMEEINLRTDFNNTRQNIQKLVKSVASHKINSKNINAPQRNTRKNRPMKLRNKSNTHVPTFNNKAPLKPKPHNNGFDFSYYSDTSNEVNNPNDSSYLDMNNNKPRLFFNQRVLSNNAANVEFTPENANVGCDLCMSVIKVLTETNGSTNLKKIDSLITQNNPQYPNIGTKFGVRLLNLGSSNLMSKSTFDWKHSRVSTCSEPHISDTSKSKQENVKVKKNISVTIGNQEVSKGSSERNDTLNQILNQSFHNQLVMELLRNNTKSLPLQDENITVGGLQNGHTEKTVEAIELPDPDLEVTECKQRKTSVADIENTEIGYKEKASTEACVFEQNSAHSITVNTIHQETNNLRLREGNPLSIENYNGIDKFTEVVECSGMLSSTDKRTPNLRVDEEICSEITIDRGDLCTVSIENPAAFLNSTEKQLKRTTISCSNAKKDPKVSITILVADGMKDEVEMKSNVMKNSSIFKDERIDQSLKEEHSPPLSSFGPRGDQLTTVRSNAYNTGSVCSLDNFSSVSCVNDKKNKTSLQKIFLENSIYPRRNNNFYVEVEDNGRQTFAGKHLNLGSPGTYLNHEKRKVLEEKVLGPNKNKSLVHAVNEKEQVLPTKSCSNISDGSKSYDHMIETSFIRKETSYSKTKFNVCKENKYSSRTSLKPSENCKRCSFSEETLNTENNFGVSTKYTSQQSVMYCRNNNVANFKTPQFTNAQDKSLGNNKFENRENPFIIVQTHENSREHTKVDAKKSSHNLWQKEVVLKLLEAPILELSENELFGENKALNEQQMEEETDIEISTSTTRLRNILEGNIDNVNNASSDKNIMDVIDRSNRKDHKQYGDSESQTETNIQSESTSLTCDYGLTDPERKDASLNTNEQRNKRGTTTLTSRISQSVVSSTLVQTDWSLVGISVDLLNSSNNKSETMGTKKRTVASQTDVMMDQIALVNKGLEEMHNSCKTCMKNCQFSELVACNVTVPQNTNLQEAPKILLGNNQGTCWETFSEYPHIIEMQIAGMPVAVINEKDSNIFEYTTSTLPMKENIFKSNLLERVQTPTLAGLSEEQQCKLKLASQCCEKSEESPKNVNENIPHRCTIPCLTILSDETIMTSLSDSSYQMTSKGIQDYNTFTQILALNSSRYFNSSDETCAPNQLLSPTVERIPSTWETNSNFCKEIENYGVDDEECSQDEPFTEPQSYLCPSEAVKESANKIMNISPDWTDRLEDENKKFIDETKLEDVLGTKKVTENTNEKQSKCNITNTLRKARKREECSSIDNYCADYLDKWCDGEKKGFSVFSQT